MTGDAHRTMTTGHPGGGRRRNKRVAAGGRSRAAVLVVLGGLACGQALAGTTPPASQQQRVEELNEAFLAHLSFVDERRALAAAAIREGWNRTYRDEAPESFVVDALATLYPEFDAALAAFDRQDDAAALAGFAALQDADDPFLAANAAYFHVRTLVGLGRYIEVEQAISDLEPERPLIDAHTAYGPHLWFLESVAQARNLRFDDAQQSLRELSEGALLPEPVANGIRQLQLEIERRERGTLGEVATVMDYVADRLYVADATDRVQRRQQEILDLLDKLIEEAEQEEGQGGGGGSQGGGQRRISGRGPQSAQRSNNPAERSEPPGGSADVGDLHAVPRVEPGELWGKLPPQERERILQIIRERYPSRYRQLVEQYYRSLAEEQ